MRVIDSLKKEELLKVAKQLNLLVPNTILKADLKSLIESHLTKRDTFKYIYPKAPLIYVIGDLHGDLEATIKSLKLANVIDKSIPNNTKDINKINWKGGTKVVVQLGDQIDRVRPAELINDLCPEHDSELIEDEGSDLKIMLLFSKLATQSAQVGGAVYSIIGNHELMNVDGDFRYVSPKEFREFGNYFKEKRSSDASVPYGFKSRTKAFKPGGALSKHMAQKRYSVLVIGSWLFVHGGITPEIAKNFLLKDINMNVRKWLNGAKDAKTNAYIQSIYHNDDESYSPFWTREFSDLETWNPGYHTKKFNQTIDLLNRNNKLKIKGMVVGHSPQFYYNKGLNCDCDQRLWRVDVGMSKAFGGECEPSRKVQVLMIKNDAEFLILREN